MLRALYQLHLHFFIIGVNLIFSLLSIISRSMILSLLFFALLILVWLLLPLELMNMRTSLFVFFVSILLVKLRILVMLYLLIHHILFTMARTKILHTHSELIQFCWNCFSSFQLLNDICFVFKRRSYFTDCYPVSLSEALTSRAYPLVQREIDLFYNLLSVFNTYLHTSLYLRETSVNGLLK